MRRTADKFIIVIAALFFAVGAKAQQSHLFLPRGGLPVSFQTDTLALLKPAPRITADFYVKNLSFVCRQEFKVEKITRIPLRLRLGSLQQCNYLEGK